MMANNNEGVYSFKQLIEQYVIEIPEMLLLPQIYADRSYYPSALQFVLDPIYFGGFILVIPLAAALPTWVSHKALFHKPMCPAQSK